MPEKSQLLYFGCNSFIIPDLVMQNGQSIQYVNNELCPTKKNTSQCCQ